MPLGLAAPRALPRDESGGKSGNGLAAGGKRRFPGGRRRVAAWAVGNFPVAEEDQCCLGRRMRDHIGHG